MDKDYICKECEGTGMAVPDCGTCGGFGWVDDLELGGTMTCPECNGDYCELCKGTGEQPEGD